MKVPSFESDLRVVEGAPFTLADRDPADAGKLHKEEAPPLIENCLVRIRDLQERLYAQGQWALLIVIQGMDTSGKDGLIEHVMSGINPAGCQVVSFKAPSTTELKHDFLWRCACAVPERGCIGVFNRSHYEDVVVVRVHRELLNRQALPAERVTHNIWRERFESIRDFERHLVRNGTVVLKFFLNISREEQKERLLARIDTPDKNWKFNAGDLAERARWDDYMRAYEDAIAQTSTSEAPWYVIPADRKWFARLAVASIIAAHLERIDPKMPHLDDAAQAALLKAREQLQSER